MAQPTDETPHRFRMLWESLPIALGMVGAKVAGEWLLNDGKPWGWIEFNSDLNVIFTGALFLMGFVLSGTIADYKEAERLPGEIACQLEILEDWMAECVVQQQIHGVDKDRLPRLQHDVILGRLLDSTEALIAWFHSREKRSDVLFHAIKQLESLVTDLARYESLKGITVRMYGDLNALRKAASRAFTIARTDFLGTAYTLFECFIGFIFVLLLVCKFKTTLTGAVICGFLSLTYWYLYRLIRDVDNPFGYGDGYNEVRLDLIERYRLRLRERLQAVAAPTPP
jgi:hypothetical protein